jgi:transcriptional regulator with XRE-family HTH domain
MSAVVAGVVPETARQDSPIMIVPSPRGSLGEPCAETTADSPAARDGCASESSTATAASRRPSEISMPAETRNPRHGALDAALGERIRRRRRELGLSQSVLGGRLGITFQQVQKYENGTNRVSAVTLTKLADALSLPVTELLQDADLAATGDPDDQGAQLMAAFGRIQSPELRAAVLILVRSLNAR